MSKPITKWSFQVENPNEIPSVFSRAFAIALEGRPGPVLIDIPMDVQRAQIEDATIESMAIEEYIDHTVLYQLMVDIQHAKDHLF
ncbi:MAG: hypothetical protein IPJ13_13005 [Saprospiraceae bacterium]|nr:hypothetical protein [Saprospiraceae bacterium]